MIKSYTDLEQSKRLAKMLPLESADMYYSPNAINTEGQVLSYNPFPKCIETIQFNDGKEIFAWSLSALLSVLPAECECMSLEHINYGNNYKEYFMHYIGGENTENYDNPVDACVAMIEKLNELKML